VLSDSLSINFGTPQGSVLSPTLFNVFINHLLKTLPTNNIVAYADDLTILCNDHTKDGCLNQMQQ
jgi:retron-type reverse transcriptase